VYYKMLFSFCVSLCCVMLTIHLTKTGMLASAERPNLFNQKFKTD